MNVNKESAQAEAHVAPIERTHFNALLLANPNHFGTLADSSFKPIKMLASDTRYEELKCVGYNPDLNLLKAIVIIKQNGGYSGPLCSAGSTEYVRFYLSFDNGASWQDQGYSSFATHDLPGSKPLDYAVSVKPDIHGSWCYHEVLPRVRAILSWNTLPPANTPNYVPVWGNVVDAHIQIKPRQLFLLSDLIAEAKIKLPVELAGSVNLAEQLTVPPSSALSTGELLSHYADKAVQTHRTLYSALSTAHGAAYALPQAALVKVDINIAAVLEAINKTQGDTSYEQLDCIGLDPNGTPNLVATFGIKRPYGYLGAQCTAGSSEYVAFFVDWLDGAGWHWVGTSQVKVHDFKTIPADGLRYTVSQPISIADHQKLCKAGPVYAKVRGVLSWQTQPPSWNPNYVPTWGNHIDGLIEIAPGVSTPVGNYTPYLEGVCGVAICDINSASGYAPGERPFGGSLNIYGYIPGAPTVNTPEADRPRYRVQVCPSGTNAWQPLSDPFGVTIEQQIGGGVPTSYSATQTATDGYYTWQDATPDATQGWRQIFPSHLLTVWNTLGKTGKWDIQIDAYDPVTDIAYPAGALSCSSTATIDLDNAAPLTSLAITGYSRNGGPIQAAVDCATFQVGDVIYGTYSVSDEHFNAVTLSLQPTGPAHGTEPQLSLDNFVTTLGNSHGYDGSNNTGESGQWRLDTAALDPCGYTVQLLSSDRTIVSCGSGWENNSAFVGFCLVAVPAANG